MNRVVAIWTFVVIAAAFGVANFITLRDIDAKRNLIVHNGKAQ